jgi:alkylation response protein AidB-like acyl-CoA dehydrogenase
MSVIDIHRTSPANQGNDGNDPAATGAHPSAVEAALVARAAACGPVLAANASRYDRVGAWVHDSYETVRAAGLLAAAVPTELGGDGATIRQVAMVQRELAKHCGSTALASAMHQHVTAFTAWRYRRQLPGAEATLRRIAQEGIVVVSTGGGDYTHPKGEAVKVEGGFRVSGRKSFVSQSPVGAVLSTMFPYDDPERGLRVLNMAVPFSAPGVSIVEDWDVHGMRGTASHDVRFDDVFVPEDKIMADRPHGTIDGPLQVISSIGFAVISAVYLGIAEGVRGHIVARFDGRPTDPSIERQVGLIDHRLRVAAWALDGALLTIGDDPAPSMANVVAVMAAKREIALAAAEVCDIAMQLAGREAFTKGNAIERAHRDVRAAGFHPLDPEKTLVHAGRFALGLACDRPADWAR